MEINDTTTLNQIIQSKADEAAARCLIEAGISHLIRSRLDNSYHFRAAESPTLYAQRHKRRRKTSTPATSPPRTVSSQK